MARPKPTPTRRLFGLRLNEELLTELRHAALDLKRPANQLLEEAIENFIKNYRKGVKDRR